ncbi:MAG: hypothetical protein ACI3YC_02750, partial [Alloprevotella sp.]
MKQTLLLLMVLTIFLPVRSAETNDKEIRRSLELADSLHSAGRTDSAAIVGARTISLAQEKADPTLLVAAFSAQGVYL